MQYTIIYMAAGNSRRFGNENKLLREFCGKPLYQHGLELLLEVVEKREDVRLVVIAQERVILEEVEKYESSNIFLPSIEKRISIFLNPDSRKGVSYTIRRGIREALAAGPVDYFLFMTADQPFLSRETLEKFFWMGEGKESYPVLSAAYGERLGNPVMFRANLAEELMQLKEDEGGRKVWRRYAGQGCLIQVRDCRELQDIDVPEDFKNISTE